MELDLKRGERIVRKEENRCYEHFLLFQQCVPKALFLGPLNSGEYF